MHLGALDGRIRVPEARYVAWAPTPARAWISVRRSTHLRRICKSEGYRGSIRQDASLPRDARPLLRTPSTPSPASVGSFEPVKRRLEERDAGSSIVRGPSSRVVQGGCHAQAARLARLVRAHGPRLCRHRPAPLGGAALQHRSLAGSVQPQPDHRAQLRRHPHGAHPGRPRSGQGGGLGPAEPHQCPVGADLGRGRSIWPGLLQRQLQLAGGSGHRAAARRPVLLGPLVDARWQAAGRGRIREIRLDDRRDPRHQAHLHLRPQRRAARNVDARQ